MIFNYFLFSIVKNLFIHQYLTGNFVKIRGNVLVTLFRRSSDKSVRL